jgi:hypothetical protein
LRLQSPVSGPKWSLFPPCGIDLEVCIIYMCTTAPLLFSCVIKLQLVYKWYVPEKRGNLHIYYTLHLLHQKDSGPKWWFFPPCCIDLELCIIYMCTTAPLLFSCFIQLVYTLYVPEKRGNLHIYYTLHLLHQKALYWLLDKDSYFFIPTRWIRETQPEDGYFVVSFHTRFLHTANKYPSYERKKE